MTMGVFDFRSIKRKLDCMDQKAEYEAKNPPAPEPSMYGWPYGVAVPMVSEVLIADSAESEAAVANLSELFGWLEGDEI